MACAWIDYDSEQLVHVETLKYADQKVHWSAVAPQWYHPHLNPDHMTNTFAVVVEFPDHIKPLPQAVGVRIGSGGGSNKQVSDLCKVALAIGYLSAGIKQSTGIQPVLVEPRGWKGSKKKETTAFEILPAMEGFKRANLDPHETDAVGIGFWWIKQDKTGKLPLEKK